MAHLLPHRLNDLLLPALGVAAGIMPPGSGAAAGPSPAVVVNGQPLGDDLRQALQQRFGAANGPRHWDRARYTDEAGHDNVFGTAYWDDPSRFDAWFAAHGRDWTRTARDGLGCFTEILRPDVRYYETLFSSPDRSEGIATLATSMSDVVMEHAYWGGARDRMPASQTEAMEPSGEPRIERDGARTSITGQ